MNISSLGTAYFLLFFYLAVVTSVSSEECFYRIDVKTGTVSGAGTNSKISLILKDARGSQLNISNLAEEYTSSVPDQGFFQSGSLDTFYVWTTSCMGSPICSLTLTSDNSGDEPDWYVDYVQVYSWLETPLLDNVRFEINGWLATNEPPYSLTRTIDDKCPTENCSHKILVKTGTLSGAGTPGTQAKISLILKAQGRDELLITNLEQYGRSIIPNHVFFQNGTLDEFVIDTICMESIFSITLTSDNSGVLPDWYVDYVEVIIARSGAVPHENLRFQINGWLGTNFPPYNLTRIFYKCSQPAQGIQKNAIISPK